MASNCVIKFKCVRQVRVVRAWPTLAHVADIQVPASWPKSCCDCPLYICMMVHQLIPLLPCPGPWVNLRVVPAVTLVPSQLQISKISQNDEMWITCRVRPCDHLMCPKFIYHKGLTHPQGDDSRSWQPFAVCTYMDMYTYVRTYYNLKTEFRWELYITLVITL